MTCAAQDGSGQRTTPISICSPVLRVTLPRCVYIRDRLPRYDWAAPSALRRMRGHVMPEYAELHAHTNLSLLDGTSDPEDMAERGAALGLKALAVTDHD